MAKIKEGDKVEVEWVDITAFSGWGNLEHARTAAPAKCKDVGYFLNRDEEVVRIFNSISENGDMGFTVFPASVVVKMTRIKD